MSTRYLGTSSLLTPCIKVRSTYLVYSDGSASNEPNQSFISVASIHTGFVQCLQCYYQSGCLYRLRALGERHNLDLTVGEICRPRTCQKPSVGLIRKNECNIWDLMVPSGVWVCVFGVGGWFTITARNVTFGVFFRGISVMDVERTDISVALPLFWSCEYSHDTICSLIAA